MICPECKGKGTAVYSCATHPDENSVEVRLFEDICHTCHGGGHKPQTNADRIRAMSDEELAEFLWFFDKKETARECVVLDGGIAIMTRRQLVSWLRQPVKDGDNDG